MWYLFSLPTPSTAHGSRGWGRLEQVQALTPPQRLLCCKWAPHPLTCPCREVQTLNALRPTYRELLSAVAEQCAVNLMPVFCSKALPPLHSVQQRLTELPGVSSPISHHLHSLWEQSAPRGCGSSPMGQGQIPVILKT